MSALLSLAAVCLCVYVLVYYCMFRAVRFSRSVQLHGHTAIVTGSSCGIGKATALDLAKRGARVILACRNRDKAEAAAYDIRSESGNCQVNFMHLDLASFKSIRCFAETFLETEPRLDLLINNAGVMGAGRTEDGFDLAFGVNHLGHFLLTSLLLERLQRCAPSRVVTVSARLHSFGRAHFPLTAGGAERVERAERASAWTTLQTYSDSKLCNVLFTRELANRLEGRGVACYCLHPGVVSTELCRGLSRWLQLLLVPFARLLFLDPEGGAQTSLYCSLQEDLESLSGRYFSGCAVQEVAPPARDDGLARKLWELSERLTGLS